MYLIEATRPFVPARFNRALWAQSTHAPSYVKYESHPTASAVRGAYA